MLTVLCFYWRGELSKGYTYGPEYVSRLKSMLARNLTAPHELVCVTDEPEGIDARVVPMPPAVRGWGGYWPKLYAFHPNGAALFGRRVLLLDLDVVIVAPLDDMVSRPEPFVAWAAREDDRARYNTSVVLMDAGAYPEVWETFDPVVSPALLASRGYARGDQDWVSYVITDGATWARSGEGIESYCAMRGKLQPDTAIVAFNGRRSPAMKHLRKASPWIKAHWR